ncbi:MAG TPA: T9SS type A sorting domain-containing protein [Fluviicola sp.]|nr:T9SS type A sorting domain-containing protein [Fluviicola sp.]
MKHLLLMPAFMLGIGFAAHAQCNQNIVPPPAMIKITSNTTLSDAEGAYWICAGLTVNITGSAGSAYFLEEDVTLNISNTDGDQVFAKPGCVITNSSDGDINVTANYSTVTINNTGSGMTITASNCPNLVYDYTMVGGSGTCGQSTAGLSDLPAQRIYAFPNPVSEAAEFYITHTNVPIDHVQVVDASGKVLQTANGDVHTISTAGLVPGSYFLKIGLTDQSMEMVRISVL